MAFPSEFFIAVYYGRWVEGEAFLLRLGRWAGGLWVEEEVEVSMLVVAMIIVGLIIIVMIIVVLTR